MISLENFEKVICQLEDVFNYNATPEMVTAYFFWLGKVFNSDEEMEEAVKNVIYKCKRFPTVADLIENKPDHRQLL